MHLSLEPNQTVTVRLEQVELEALESGRRDEDGGTMLDDVRFAAEKFVWSEDPEEWRLYHSINLCALNGQLIRTIPLAAPKEVR